MSSVHPGAYSIPSGKNNFKREINMKTLKKIDEKARPYQVDTGRYIQQKQKIITEVLKRTVYMPDKCFVNLARRLSYHGEEAPFLF